MLAKDVVSGSKVLYKEMSGNSGNGVEATLFHPPDNGITTLLVWEDQNKDNSFAWEQSDSSDPYVSKLDPKWKYCWWISTDDELELIATPPSKSKKIKLSEVKAGTRITIQLRKDGYPCAPDALHLATSKITGTIFRKENGQTIIAWKNFEKAPSCSWSIFPLHRDKCSIPGDFNRAYYLFHPDLEVEIETAKVKTKTKNNQNLGFLLSCIGVGTLMNSLFEAPATKTTITTEGFSNER
jgi:hypothetical protein